MFDSQNRSIGDWKIVEEIDTKNPMKWAKIAFHRAFCEVFIGKDKSFPIDWI